MTDGVHNSQKEAQQENQAEAAGEPLLALAEAHGVGTSFRGWDGVERQVAAPTLRRILAALGVEAETPDDVRAALRNNDLEPWRRFLPPVVVLQEGQEFHLEVHAPDGSEVRVWVTSEDGRQHDDLLQDDAQQSREVDGVLITRSTFAIPEYLPLGWHTLHAESSEGITSECALVVTPARLATTEKLSERRRWGVMAQLYSVRSSRSWGIGDFSDLVDLAAISGAEGADFVLVNPLHAAEPLPPVQDSPYLPATRRFFNPLYIRVEEIPEYGYLDPDSRATVEQLAVRLRPANQDAELLDRNSSYAAKLAALELVFGVKRSPSRDLQFAQFCAEQGQGLADFALWAALAEDLPPSSPEWTEAASPATGYSRQARERLAGRIEFHQWLQWICDQQLEAAQRAAKKAGMETGIIHDLAVGVKTDGADAWMLHDVLAPGASVGAPPDVFNQQGQDWSQPPWHPARLAESGYAPYRDMLRTILRHAGGVRVDHILGLFRLWWIPAGEGPENGTYVYYDHEALIGILALEAQRAGAIVIGEDLGVFEPWVRTYLSERGIFGTSILWFEHGPDGPLAPETYRQQCLTSVNTHDLPPTAGYLAGEHVTLREKLGLLMRPVEEERARASEEQESVLELVRQRGLLSPASSVSAEDAADGGVRDADVQRTVEALYAFTALTPSSLLGVALVDAVGETRTQNQPGTHNQYPNWCIPLAGSDGAAVLLEELPGNARFKSLLRTVRNALNGSSSPR
jgi:4-alpha-glucanotransferase